MIPDRYRYWTCLSGFRSASRSRIVLYSEDYKLVDIDLKASGERIAELAAKLTGSDELQVDCVELEHGSC